MGRVTLSASEKHDFIFITKHWWIAANIKWCWTAHFAPPYLIQPRFHIFITNQEVLAWKCFKLKTSCSELIYLDRWTWTVSCLAAQKDGSPAVFNDVAILSTLSLVCHFWHHHIFVGSQAFHIWCRHLLSIKTSSVCLMMFLATWTRTFSKYLI